MANVNKLILIGRLTREPESRTFANGGKVVSFGFASNSKKKNQATGAWEDKPMFIECKVFNRGETGKKADVAEQYLKKGHQAYLEGRLELEQWNDKTTGAARSKHVMYVDDFQFLEPKKDEGSQAPATTPNRNGGYPNPTHRGAASAPAHQDGPDDFAGDMNPPDDIPF
jgi:single-strand DNA-binding protein